MKKQQHLVFGLRAIMEALQSGKGIEKVLVKKGLKGDLFKELQHVARHHEIPLQWVPEERFAPFAQKNHQGVMGYLSAIEYFKTSQLLPTIWESGQIPFFVLLDGITDVRNFGAIARTAECAGAHAIVIPEKGSAQVTEDAIKTSAGALVHIPVCRVRSLIDEAMYLKQSGLKIVAATEHGAAPYTKADLTAPLALVMGSEEKGLSIRMQKEADECLAIPLHGKIASLNVSVAAGILMYEVLRQRESAIG